MRRLLAQLLLLVSLLIVTPSWCGALEVTLQRIDTNGLGESIGSITAQDTDQGLVIYPDLSGLTPGEHGFHLHSLAVRRARQRRAPQLPALQQVDTGIQTSLASTSAPLATATVAI